MFTFSPLVKPTERGRPADMAADTTITQHEYRDLLPVIVETTGSALPDGFDSWGIKSVHPDLMTSWLPTSRRT